MPGYAFGYTVACLLALMGGSSMFTVNGSIPVAAQEVITYEEYVIEHEISSEQARNAAVAIDLNSVEIPPGCQKCSDSEINYCQGRDFINDHCCCDKRYHEVLPYVPHTCYLGTQLCKPVVGDCATYKRLRICCCNAHVLKIWKSSAPISISQQSRTIMLFLLFLVVTFWR